jgi:hypothetical protein
MSSALGSLVQNAIGTKSTYRVKQNWHIHLSYTKKVREIVIFIKQVPLFEITIL